MKMTEFYLSQLEDEGRRTRRAIEQEYPTAVMTGSRTRSPCRSDGSRSRWPDRLSWLR